MIVGSMGKKLAMKGHPTRGKEVIELLKMMGGTNPFSNNGELLGNKETCYYYISKNVPSKYIYWNYIDSEEIDKYVIFTLEEFLKKYPFKVGDKVMDRYGDSLTIKSMEWSEDCETMVYDYTVSLKDDKVIDNSIDASQFIQIGKIAAVCFNTENYENEVELKLSDYEIVVRDGKTYAVLKKPKYPTTYAECCEKLGIEEDLWFVYEDIDGNHINSACISNYRIRGLELYHNLEKLKICRDAYWKVAGEQMGLGKPWEPDWNEETDKFTISNKCNKIYLNNTAWYAEVLSFPTAEMRNAFYENFKKEIEQCKELL